MAECPVMGSTVFASVSVLAASLTARAVGEITFNIVALLVGVGLLVRGVRLLRRPGGRGRKAGAIVMIVFGALLLLGLLGSAVGGAARAPGPTRSAPALGTSYSGPGLGSATDQSALPV